MANWKKVVVENASGTISQKAGGLVDADYGDLTVSSNSFSLDDNVVDSAEIKSGAVDIAHLSASGTAGSSTYLRGDNSWATISDANTTVSSLAFNTSTGVLTLTDSASATVTVDLDGKYAESSHTHAYVATTGNETIAGNKTFSGDTTVANLTVTGTTTTVNTTTLEVKDANILLANVDSPSVNSGDGAGISVECSSTADDFPEVKWTKAKGAGNTDGSGDKVGLTGWSVSNMHTSNHIDLPIAVMEFTAISGGSSAPSGNAGGIGSFHFVPDAQELYIRTS